MSDELILADRIGKKFCRTRRSAVLYGFADALRRAFNRPPLQALRKEEFWAVHDVSLIVRRGECLGIIGPNGAGKSTLLKLFNHDYRTDAGRLLIRGATRSLIRIGTGLQPLMSGRENIYIRCTELGLQKREIDARVDDIIAFAGLEARIDAQVRTYSDGMYARLEFAIASAVPTDIFLIDEVLAVGDIAFQMRCLDRLNELKKSGVAIVFVSHSEMNVRMIADRCLLLFDGFGVGQGVPDALFHKYYESVGYLNRALAPLGAIATPAADCQAPVRLMSLTPEPQDTVLRTGRSLSLALDYDSRHHGPARVCLEFRNAAGVLVATIDSHKLGTGFVLQKGRHRLLIRLPALTLTAGVYRVGAEIAAERQVLGRVSWLLQLVVTDPGVDRYPGLVSMSASFEFKDG